MLLGAAFWRAVAAGELDEAQPHTFAPGEAVGGAGVLRGFRHPARLALADCLHLALVVSDNDATNAVIAAVGCDRVNALAGELGLRHTILQRQMMDWQAAAAGRDNLTCAADLAELLGLLVAGDPRIGAAACERVLASLALQEHRDGLPRGLPDDATYAGKPGDDLPEGRFCHDCGVVRTPAGATLVLAVMSDGEAATPRSPPRGAVCTRSSRPSGARRPSDEADGRAGAVAGGRAQTAAANDAAGRAC